MLELDLIVTIDSALAHLAGALGKPTYVLLPYCCDWRWLQDRSDSPWYPSMQLFRQTAPRQWDQPIKQMVEAVKGMATQRQ
jgi:ADP-heptose:LPS heptosyltransferase